MKQIVTFCLVIWLLLCNSVSAQTNKPFLAVYCNPGWERLWAPVKPDMIRTAFDWDSFDSFLEEAKTRSGDSPIELDVDVHGLDTLAIQYTNINGELQSHSATLGWVLNHIEDKLQGKSYVVILEACYAGHVYRNSIRNNFPFSLIGDDIKIDNHPSVPAYPIYGSSYNHPSFGNATYLQYKTHLIYALEDLRKYETDKGTPFVRYKDDKKLPKEERQWREEYYMFWRFLLTFYKPY